MWITSVFNFNTNMKNKYTYLSRVGAIGSLSVVGGAALASADATSSAAALGTGVGSFMDTLTSVSLAFMTNSTLVTALVIAGLVFGVLYWVKSKFL